MNRLKVFSFVSYVFFYTPIVMLYLYSILGFEVFNVVGFVVMNIVVFIIGVCLNGIMADIDEYDK